MSVIVRTKAKPHKYVLQCEIQPEKENIQWVLAHHLEDAPVFSDARGALLTSLSLTTASRVSNPDFDIGPPPFLEAVTPVRAYAERDKET